MAPTSTGDGWRTALWVAHAPIDPWLLDAHLNDLADCVIRIRGRMQLATRPDTRVAVEGSSQHISLRPAGQIVAAESPTRLEVLAATQTQLEAALGLLDASLFRPQSLTARHPLGMDPFEDLWDSDEQDRQAS
jgi:G3E family GTPase